MYAMKLIRRSFVISIAVAFCWLVSSQTSSAHAILVEATPSPNSKVAGPNIAIKLRFNSRIDPDRSRLTLVLKDGTTRKLEIQKQQSADTLTSQITDLGSGACTLRWQVLATDGHITRGEFVFEIV